jgi:predicted DNA binding CopG/RHH family protein
MKKHKEIDPKFYEENDFSEDILEAHRNGELLRPINGKNAVQVMREYMEAKKKTAISMRLPVYVIKGVKAQAKKAGVPYTTYICAVLERALAEPRRT